MDFNGTPEQVELHQNPVLFAQSTLNDRLLERGTAGAIAGPIVEFDVRTLYLNDLSFFGCTFQAGGIFENLLSYIEREEVKPLAQSYALKDIVQVQRDFIAKKHTGKLVLVPPQD